MFTRSEQYYDAIYSGKDYAAEAAHIKKLIAQHKRSDGNTLLDVACGTGGHLPYLRGDFDYEGLDLDPEMLALARKRYPDVVFHQGDMVDFTLGRRFDVVTCLFSSIAYTRTEQRLRQAIANLAGHVRPGGVLLIGSFLTPQEWIPGHPHAMFVDEPDLKLARMNVSGVEGNVAILDSTTWWRRRMALNSSPSAMNWGSSLRSSISPLSWRLVLKFFAIANGWTVAACILARIPSRGDRALI